MIRVNVNLVSATITETETLTSGRVGLECGFTFSDEWAGLSKIAVFEGSESMDVAVLVNDTVTVPHECLASPGAKLRIGVYGMNNDGDIVIPTVFANAGRIQQGAEPSGVSPADPTPSWAAQVQEAAGNALALSEEVNSAYKNGELNGSDGVSPTVSVTSITGGHNVAVTDVNGTQNFDVMDGTDGADIFEATYGTTSNADIEAAYQAGKICVCKYGDNIYYLAYRGSSTVHTFVVYLNNVGYYVRNSGGTWANGSISLATVSSVPAAATATPADLGSAAVGSSSKYAKEDHVHNKPTYSASDVGAIAAPVSPSDGDFLVYDSNSSAWVAQAVPAANGEDF